ncbi:MAG: aminotransferase class I/II-fold pyridoxal phosphate-dependent enzyme [Victivallales bacterium]|nr:aminotransferase class I/II-fold pyridoxal phosphate-dependent enzyme [Victivallales bacterium]
MRKEFLPFSKPSITEEDIQAVGDVLRSGWITTGKHNAALEQEICAYTGAAEAVAVCSGTAGMHCLLQALGIGPGDEVITPSMTWVSTVNLISILGATPVFADIDRDTMLVTPETVAACLTPKTKAIIPVHFAGQPCDIDAIYALAEPRGIAVIEDAAHAIGTRYKGRHVGTRGSAVYSMHPIKNITAGEGGVVVGSDHALMDKVRQLKFHGLGVDAFDRQTQGRAPQAEVVIPGYKYNLTDMCAVLGRRQLARLDEFDRKRTELAQYYLEQFRTIAGILPLGAPQGYDFTPAWNLFAVRVDRPDLSRNEFMAALKQRNIGTGLHFRAIHSQKYYRERTVNAPGGLANTEWNSDRICSLPLFPEMTRGDVDDVVAAIRDVLNLPGNAGPDCQKVIRRQSFRNYRALWLRG